MTNESVQFSFELDLHQIHKKHFVTTIHFNELFSRMTLTNDSGLPKVTLAWCVIWQKIYKGKRKKLYPLEVFPKKVFSSGTKEFFIVSHI